MNERNKCPLCASSAIIKSDAYYDVIECECTRCGKYMLYGETLILNASPQDKKSFLILSSYIRELYQSSGKSTVLAPDYFYKMIDMAKASVPSFSERIFKLLHAMEKRLNHAADRLDISSRQEELKNYLMAMSYSLGEEEFFYYVDCLKESGYIKIPDTGDSLGYQLTPQAWEYLEKYKANDRTRSDKAFIAMDFKEEYEPIYITIEKVLTEAGYKAIRADKEHHSEYIMDWIMAKIKEARFIVAELTSQNLGVYYEFGYAKAHNIPIIACLKKAKEESDQETLKKVHFDLKQFPIIIYESSDEKDLGEKVLNRILNLVGKRGQ